MQTEQAISLREFAKTRGCSHVAVHKAIKSGRVTAVVRGSGGRITGVFPAAASAQWAAGTDVEQQHRGAAGGVRTTVYSERIRNGDLLTQQDDTVEPAPVEVPAAERPADVKAGYAAQQAEHARLKAELTRLQLAERTGELVRADAVQRQAFTEARRLRDRLLALPDRLAADLAAEHNTAVVHARLTRELRQVLEELSAPAEEDPPA
jgi:hypothetical protein